MAQGRVQVLPAGDTVVSQAQMAVAELQRLSALDPEWDWAKCAVIAREWSYLDPVRSLCELEGIPVQLANEEFTGVWHLRETRALLNWLRERGSSLVTGDDLDGWLANQPDGPWVELLREGVDEYALETGGAETPVEHFTEWRAEWGRDVRRQQRGLLLLTAYRAKGLEFDHVVVLDGGWNRVGRGEYADAPRRLYYVAMTRARQTLTLTRLPGVHHFQDALRSDPAVLHREAPVAGHVAPAPELLRRVDGSIATAEIRGYVVTNAGTVAVVEDEGRAPTVRCFRTAGAASVLAWRPSETSTNRRCLTFVGHSTGVRTETLV